jgi:hypothetical protein
MSAEDQFNGVPGQYEQRQYSHGPNGLPGQSEAAAFGHSAPIPPPENFTYPEDTDNDSPLFATDEFRVWYDQLMRILMQSFSYFFLLFSNLLPINFLLPIFRCMKVS